LGPLATGRADGQGIQVWISMQDGKSLEEMFTGKLKDSKEQGRGVLLMASGERYEGEFKDSEMHGSGVYVWADGAKIEGDWMDGKIHGISKMQTNEGNCLIVEYDHDKVIASKSC
jgi:hypothetical protein